MENSLMSKIIAKSFDDFIKSISTREKNNENIYTNICISGAACEHWFQFGLTSKIINNINFPEYFPEPEKKSYDIIIWNKDIINTAIELNTIANWYIDDNHIHRIISDIEKLEKADRSIENKFAFLFTTYASPTEGKLQWMEEQINGKKGIRLEDEFYSIIKKYIQEKTKNKVTKLDQSSWQNKIFNKISISGFLIEI